MAGNKTPSYSEGNEDDPDSQLEQNSQDPPIVAFDLDVARIDSCTMHLRYLISERSDLEFKAPITNPFNTYVFSLCDDRLRLVVEEILSIDGIASLLICPYAIDLEKSGAYSWYELFPKILAVVAKIYCVPAHELLISMRSVCAGDADQVQIEQE